MSSLRSIAQHPIISLIKSNTNYKSLTQIHTQMLINGLLNDPHFLGHFVTSIALKNPNNLHYSNHVLSQCYNPTVLPLNTMIRVYSKSSTPQKSFDFYRKIQSSPNVSPDNYTFTFLVRTCAQLLVRDTGLLVHCDLMKHGFGNDPHVQSGLIYMYAELGCLGFCHKVFDEIAEPDLVCQTAMVSMCAKSGDVTIARKLFNEMSVKDPIAWNAMIAGYAQCGESREALNLFNLMRIEGVKVNEISMVSVLSACSHLGTLDHGRWAHAYIDRYKLRMTVTMGSALIDMYAKCGNMNKAMEVFWALEEKNVYTWTIVINGLAMNGHGEECLKLFSLMNQHGVEPNEVTFVSVLRGCSVAGLVDEGKKYFESIKSVYGVEPQLEHYGCMVDLYGRAGRFNDALSFINNMPMKPHSGAWGSLLNACRMYKNTELAELAFQELTKLEPNNHNAYVVLSNIYADNKDWKMASSVRQIMRDRSVKKLPGCSVMEV